MRPSPRARILILSLIALPALAAPTGARAERGSAGVGDPYFPKAGNGGYGVARYRLRLDYEPATNQLAAVRGSGRGPPSA